MSNVEILEFRKIQESTQTPGPKCNRCFYDIIWDKPTSEQLYGPGKNRPFEMTKGTGHTCPIDQQNNYITRKGYTKDNVTNKVIWIGMTGSLPPPPPQQEQQMQFTQSAIPSSSSADRTIKLPAQPNSIIDIAAQMGGLTNSVKQLAAAYEAVAMRQNEEIAKLKTIVDEYIRHNPLESSFLELTKRMMSYLPEAELGPKTADQYKVGFEST
jgi:hypothetical protein